MNSGLVYRYGFGGMERDDETCGKSNALDFGARIYDSKLGRWLSVDAFAMSYPFVSPYVYALNSPLYFEDNGGNFPAPSKVLARFGMTLPPFSAGLIDGAFEASPFGMASFAWKLTKDGEFRTQIFNAFSAIASEPVGAAKLMFEEYTGLMQRMMDGKLSPEDEERLGQEIGSGIVGLISGGAILKYSKKLLDLMPNSNVAKKASKSKICGCFTAGTLILTKYGMKAIEEIQLGDSVWAYSDSLNIMSLQPVIDVFSRQFSAYYRIYFKGEVLNVTHEHPFFIRNTWVKAEQLRIGETLETYYNQIITIDSIQFIEKNDPLYVYNFTVDNFHTYYVSYSGILVHNGNHCEFGNHHDFFAKAKIGKLMNSKSERKGKVLNGAQIFAAKTDIPELGIKKGDYWYLDKGNDGSEIELFDKNMNVKAVLDADTGRVIPSKTEAAINEGAKRKATLKAALNK